MQQESVAHCNRGGSWKPEDWCCLLLSAFMSSLSALWWAAFSAQRAKESHKCVRWQAKPLTIHQLQTAPSDPLLCWEKRGHKNMFEFSFNLYWKKQRRETGWRIEINQQTKKEQKESKGERGRTLRVHFSNTDETFFLCSSFKRNKARGLIWHCRHGRTRRNKNWVLLVHLILNT